MSNSIYRHTLAAVFLTAAVLKTHAYISGVNGRGALEALADPRILWTLVGLDVAIALGCVSRGVWRVLAAWAAIAVVVVGNFVLLDDFQANQGSSCGCFGAVKLNVLEHAVLAICVFFLAARTLVPTQGTRTSK